MYRQALKLMEKALGRDYPDMLTSVNNLGNALARQGKYAEAKAM